MIKKVEKKGKNIGNEFWACSAFPKCRHTEAGNV
jgi:ssDNA-binding Zn-finger/Zn-ribbon topoisomerase 1